MKQSSVSPLRWLVITVQPSSRHVRTASIASVTEPIWFTFSSSELQHFFSMAFWMRMMFVTVRSSPTMSISTPHAPRPPPLAPRHSRMALQPAKSSSSKPSSIEMIGYRATRSS